MMDFNTKQMKKNIQITMDGVCPQAHMATCLKQNNVNTNKSRYVTLGPIRGIIFNM